MLQGVAQNAYQTWVDSAHAEMDLGNYDSATRYFQLAFDVFGGRGYPPDRYRYAQAWAQRGYADSAFFHLFRLAARTDELDCLSLPADSLLLQLHTDVRWDSLMGWVNPHGEKEDTALTQFLLSIRARDQTLRLLLPSLERIHTRESEWMRSYWKKVNEADSLNILQIDSLIQARGWPGPCVAGRAGSQTVWLVIQHAPLRYKEQYLPRMRQAVEEGRASRKDYVFLLDRVRMHQGKPQLYGTQYHRNPETGETELWPVEKPEELSLRWDRLWLDPVPEE